MNWDMEKIHFDLTTKLLTNISFEIIAINLKYSACSKSMPGHFQRRNSVQLQCLHLKSLSDQQFFISSKKNYFRRVLLYVQSTSCYVNVFNCFALQSNDWHMAHVTWVTYSFKKFRWLWKFEYGHSPIWKFLSITLILSRKFRKFHLETVLK